MTTQTHAWRWWAVGHPHNIALIEKGLKSRIFGRQQGPKIDIAYIISLSNSSRISWEGHLQCFVWVILATGLRFPYLNILCLRKLTIRKDYRYMDKMVKKVTPFIHIWNIKGYKQQIFNANMTLIQLLTVKLIKKEKKSGVYKIFKF